VNSWAAPVDSAAVAQVGPFDSSSGVTSALILEWEVFERASPMRRGGAIGYVFPCSAAEWVARPQASGG